MVRLCVLVRYHCANSSASLGCLVPAITEIAEPPHMPLRLAPAVHCGIGATAHLPEVSCASLVTTPCPQTAEGHEAIVPLSSPAPQSLEKSATVETRPLLIRSCQ